jgi:hypothetical protein
VTEKTTVMNYLPETIRRKIIILDELIAASCLSSDCSDCDCIIFTHFICFPHHRRMSAQGASLIQIVLRAVLRHKVKEVASCYETHSSLSRVSEIVCVMKSSRALDMGNEGEDDKENEARDVTMCVMESEVQEK